MAYKTANSLDMDGNCDKLAFPSANSREINMKYKALIEQSFLLPILLLCYIASSSALTDAELYKKAREITQNTLIIDTHIDVPYRIKDSKEDVTQATEKGNFDYPRAIAGGLNAPFMSIYIPAQLQNEKGASKKEADHLIDLMENIAKNAPDKFAIAYNTDDLQRHFKEHKISLPMGMENGSAIEGNLDNLRHFYKRGIRYITLTHSKSNHISDSSYDENRQWYGLSEFGKKLVKEMNKTGIMVDVSHISDTAFYQVIEISETPVIATHSSCRHFTPGFERNMSDDMIKRLAAKNGVIQINFGSSFIKEEFRQARNAMKKAVNEFKEKHQLESSDEKLKIFSSEYQQKHPLPFASLNDILDHIDHVVKIASVHNVAIGSDYDGVGDSLPTGLKDVSTYPNLVVGLLKRGYSENDIKQILSGNTLRVWKEVENYAAKQQ